MTVIDAGNAGAVDPRGGDRESARAERPPARAERLPARQPVGPRARRPWLAPAAVVLVGLLAAVAVRAASAPVAPTVWMTGLPERVVAGDTFVPQVHVRFPDRWPRADHGGVLLDRASVGVTARAVLTEQMVGQEAEAVVCSTGVVHATGELVDLHCEVTAPSPGPWVLTVHVSAHGDPAWTTRTPFTHHVVAP